MAAVAVAAAVLGAVGLAATDAPARWLVVEDAAAPVDAAVVLAGDPDYERTTTAARLVLSGEARLLVLTGGEPGPGDSAESLRRWALRKGVPADRIRMEEVSRSTREAVVALLPILEREGVRSVALVTSPFHQRRSWLAARRAWPRVTVVNRPARPSSWRPDDWWRERRSREIVLKEYGKLAYYAARGWL